MRFIDPELMKMVVVTHISSCVCLCLSAIDLCAEGKHDCQQICVASPGAFTCDCNKGYKLNDDKKTCTSQSHMHTNTFKHFFFCNCNMLPFLYLNCVTALHVLSYSPSLTTKHIHTSHNHAQSQDTSNSHC